MTPGPAMLRVRVLGSGTSMGVPVIGCQCPVCRSADPCNKRLRSSIALEAGDCHLLVDCSIDFRAQMLRWPMPWIDAILLTHVHSDHVSGLDDLRAYNFLQRKRIPVYSTRPFLEQLEQRFAYCFHPAQAGGGVPQIEPRAIEPGHSFEVKGLSVLPVEILHGRLPILGFRIGSLAYLTDCSEVPAAARANLEGLDVLILSALRHTPHPTHFSLGEAMETARQLGVRRVYFTHVGDELDHQATNRRLPEWAQLAYDGQRIEVPYAPTAKGLGAIS